MLEQIKLILYNMIFTIQSIRLYMCEIQRCAASSDREVTLSSKNSVGAVA